MKSLKILSMGCLALACLVMSGCGLFSKKSPYDLAKEGNIRMLKLFLEGGGDVNGKYGGQDRSLLYGAVEAEKADTARFLIERGADVNFKDSYENTPLMHSIRYGHLETVQLLLDKGARVNEVNKRGQSAVYRAVSRGEWELTGLLLRNGANVNFQDDGTSLLHLAVKQGDLRLVQLLLDQKVRVNVKNEDGFTPRFYAEEFSFHDISRLLKKRGARLNHSAPTEAYYKRIYAKRLGKGPLRVRRVIKHRGISQGEVYSGDGALLAQVLEIKKDASAGRVTGVRGGLRFKKPARGKHDQDYKLRVWEVRRGKVKFPDIPLDYFPSSLEFASDGKLLLTNAHHPGIEVWDPATGKKIRTIGREEGTVLGTAQVGSSRYIVAGEDKRAFTDNNILSSGYPVFKEMVGGLEHSVWMYDYGSGRRVREYTGHMSVIREAGFSFDGRFVASISSRSFSSMGPLRVWETASGRPVRMPRHLGWIHGIIPFPDDRRLAAVNHSRTLILDMENGQVVRHIREGGNHAGLLQKGRYLAFNKYEQLSLVSTQTGRVVQKANFKEELNRMGVSEYLTSLKASPAGDSLIVTTSHGKLIFFQLK